MEDPLPDNTWIRVGIYVLYSLIVFVIAFALTFPDAQITDIAEVQLENVLERAQKTNYRVDIGDVDPWWIGAELEEVEVTKVVPAPASSGSEQGNSSNNSGKQSGDGPASSSNGNVTLSTPSIGVRFAPIESLLRMGLAAKYHLGVGGGSISGVYARSSGSQAVTVEIASIDLRESRLMSKLTSVPAFGQLDGYATFQFDANRPVLTGGSFELTGSQLTVGPKESVELPGIPLANLTIPQTNFGDLNLRLHVDYKKGKGPPTLVVDEFNTQGRDLKSQIWGNVKLANTLAKAQTQIKMRLNFNPDFIKNNELTPLLQQDMFRNGRSGDWYGFVLWGPLGSPNFKGATTPAKGPEKNKKGSKKKKKKKKKK